MPVIPASNYSTGAQVLALVQDLCNDPQGQLFTASFCLQAINSGCRYIARELRNRGKVTLVEDEYPATIPVVLASDPAQQVNWTFTGINGNVTPAATPFLPQNLYEPLKIWERPAGVAGQFGEFNLMTNKTDSGGLDKRNAYGRLADWEWRTDMICFVGALQDTDIILRFNALPLIFTIDVNGAISGSLGDLDALDAVGYYAAAQLIPKHGGAPTLIAQYQQEAKDLIEQLSTSTSRAEQMAPVRMKPYGGSGRGRWLRSY